MMVVILFTADTFPVHYYLETHVFYIVYYSLRGNEIEMGKALQTTTTLTTDHRPNCGS